MNFRDRLVIGDPKQIAKRDKKYSIWRRQGELGRRHRKYSYQQPKQKRRLI